MSLKNPKVGFVSLGCPKALVDSERILTQLKVEGYDIVGSYDKADVVVVNTCGFIESAVNESLDAIGEAGRAVDQRPAGLHQRDECGARRAAAEARSLHRPASGPAQARQEG
jgi:tRNA A37 methylthiotransferase MiaB